MWVVNTHIAVSSQVNQTLEVEQLWNWLQNQIFFYRLPVILLGDFNGDPSAPHVQWLSKLMDDNWLGCGNGGFK